MKLTIRPYVEIRGDQRALEHWGTVDVDNGGQHHFVGGSTVAPGSLLQKRAWLCLQQN